MNSKFYLTDLRLDYYIGKAINNFSNLIAFISKGKGITYKEFGSYSTLTADVLTSAKLERNEPVIVVIQNIWEDMAFFYAIWKSGGVVVPLFFRINNSNASQILRSVETRFVIGKNIEELNLFWLKDGWTALSDDVVLLNNREIKSDVNLEDAALVVHTSGSTGKPKGVIQSHERYCRKLESIVRILEPPMHLKLLQPLQLTFSFGQWSTILVLLLGGTVELMPKFDSLDFINRTSQKSNYDWSPLVPSMWRLLFHELDNGNYNHYVPQIKCCLVGGEPMPVDLGKKLRKKWPQMRSADIYGLTETNSADFILHPDDFDQYPGSIGLPSPGVAFRIVNKDGINLGIDQTGELEVATCYLFKAYLRKPEETVKAMRDGYFKTGDLACMSNNGRVYLKGRSKEQINYAGFEISPLEVEEVFDKHKDIKSCLVFGLSDKTYGMIPAIMIVSQTPENIKESYLKEWASKFLESYKIPKSFFYVDDLPIGKTGKVNRLGAIEYLKEMDLI